MIKWFSPVCAGLLLAAQAGRAEPFDYYVLALTWTPSWCAAEGDPRDGQCDPDRDLGFTLHGLWPQYEEGWPEDCTSDAADPSRRETAAMADIMGSGGLAWYQWKKHGRCAGLSAQEYFSRARRVYRALDLPRPQGGRATPQEVEAAVLAANPALGPDGVIVTCRGGRIEEVRICLTPELAPRACAPDVLADACRQRGPQTMPPVP